MLAHFQAAVRSTTAAALLACAAFAAQDARSSTRSATIAPDAATLGEHGPSTSFELTSAYFGTLSVWAEADHADLYMRLEDEHGALLAEDDDTGGGTTPWIRHTTPAGVRFTLRVSVKNANAPTALRLEVRELEETDATRRAYENASSGLEETRVSQASGDHVGARERLTAVADALLADAAIRGSVSFHKALMQIGRQFAEWSDGAACLKVALVRRDAMRGWYPPLSEAWVEVHHEICNAYLQLEARADALVACAESLELFEGSFPKGNVNISIARLAYGQALSRAQQLEEARDQMERAVADARAGTSDALHILYMEDELASVLYALGLHEDSRRLHQHCVDQLESQFPADDRFLMSARNNLAASLSELGDKRGALAMHQRNLAIAERSWDHDHPERLNYALNVGVCKLALGDAAEALPLLEDVRATLARLDLASTDTALFADVAAADALTRLGRPKEALDVVLARRKLREASGMSDAVGAWRVGSQIAHALSDLGRKDEALVEAELAHQAALRAFPVDNPDLAETRQHLAKLCLEQGQRERAWNLAVEAVDGACAYLVQCATTLSMRQAEAAQAHWSRLVSDGLVLLDATAAPEQRARADALGFELTETARGIGGAMLRVLNVDATASADLEALRRNVSSAAREVARLGAVATDATTLASAIAAKERAERALRDELSRAIGFDSSELRGDLALALRDLAANEAAIAYWRSDRRAFEMPLSAPRAAYLSAFVIGRDRIVKRVEFGSLAPIAAAATAWRAAIASSDDARERAAGAALRTLIVDPLLPLLADTTRWRIALDDVLHLVPLDALPFEEGRLGDRASIVVAPTLTHRTAVSAASVASLVAVGGVDYDFDSGSAPRASELSERVVAALRGGPWEAGFGELWGTQHEIEAIAVLFAESRGTAQPACTLLDERAATKSALIREAAHATYVHIATHGFFAMAAHSASSPTEAVLAERSPLALCGLALTGANLGPQANGFEGLITAEELATLDLSHCRLVVLSACDTNVGTLASGQGVASFQKALHSAGAGAVVTSLWKVEDAATRELMVAFYAGLWREKLEPADALWAAKQALRARRAPLGEWAGWVLSASTR